MVVFKQIQDIKFKLLESPPMLLLSWTVSDAKGVQVLFRKGLVCNCENSLHFLKEFYENLNQFVREETT